MSASVQVLLTMVIKIEAAPMVLENPGKSLNSKKNIPGLASPWNSIEVQLEVLEFSFSSELCSYQ